MLAVVAFAMTMVMVMGDFDLSVGAMASLSGVVAGVLFAQGYGWPPAGRRRWRWGCWGACFNGLLVAVAGILPFVATLGTLPWPPSPPRRCPPCPQGSGRRTTQP
jgi:ribose transport system permease protein